MFSIGQLQFTIIWLTIICMAGHCFPHVYHQYLYHGSLRTRVDCMFVVYVFPMLMVTKLGSTISQHVFVVNYFISLSSVLAETVS